MNTPPSFPLPHEEQRLTSPPLYGNGANSSNPATSFRYLEAMTVRSGAEAARVKTGESIADSVLHVSFHVSNDRCFPTLGPQAPLLIEPVVIPRIGNIDVEQVTRLDSKGLFYPNGSKGANLQRMVMAKINDSGMESQSADKKRDQNGSRLNTGGSSRPASPSRSRSRSPTMRSSAALSPHSSSGMKSSYQKSVSQLKASGTFRHPLLQSRRQGAGTLTTSRPPLFYSKKRDPIVDRTISSLRSLEEHMDTATGVKT
jgi:hypothetical protein